MYNRNLLEKLVRTNTSHVTKRRWNCTHAQKSIQHKAIRNRQHKHNRKCYLEIKSLPPNNTNHATNAMFIDHLMDLLTEKIPRQQNTIILGDFNMHIEDLTETDTIIFNNTMQTLGLKQHVTRPAHKQGNTLDLIFTELTSGCQVLFSYLFLFMGIILFFRKNSYFSTFLCFLTIDSFLKYTNGPCFDISFSAFSFFFEFFKYADDIS